MAYICHHCDLVRDSWNVKYCNKCWSKLKAENEKLTTENAALNDKIDAFAAALKLTNVGMEKMWAEITQLKSVINRVRDLVRQSTRMTDSTATDDESQEYYEIDADALNTLLGVAIGRKTE